MRRVAHQPVAVEIVREKLFAEGDALLLAHPFDAALLPHLFRRLDDERRRLAVVLVRVRLEPAVLRFGKCERERLEQLFRPEPHETAAADVDVRRVRRHVPRPDPAVDAVGGEHEIGAEFACCRHVVGDVGLEHELDAQVLAALLQDVEQAFPADPAETMAARGDRAPLEVDVDVVPVIERAGDLARRLGVGGLEVCSVLSEKTTPQPKVS